MLITLFSQPSFLLQVNANFLCISGYFFRVFIFYFPSFNLIAAFSKVYLPSYDTGFILQRIPIFYFFLQIM